MKLLLVGGTLEGRWREGGRKLEGIVDASKRLVNNKERNDNRSLDYLLKR